MSKKRFIKLAAISVAAMFAASCSNTYKEINYLQNVEAGEKLSMVENDGIRIQPMDMLNIIVTCHNLELARTVNLPVAAVQAGGTEASSQQRIIGYVVDNDGCINYPVLGNIHVAGMSRWELQGFIARRLIEERYIMDPIVTVQFLNYMVSVMGEVARPGSITIDGDKITVLDAISRAGDLTIHGRRDNVKVIREENGKREIYELDLRDKSIFSSPAFYLKQNDVVYVTPSSVRAGQSKINENNFKNVSFWISIGSFLVTIATLVVNLTNRPVGGR